jgi:excisionase family DNA binding protein
VNDDLNKTLRNKAVLTLWPETAKILGLTRGAVYRAAVSGDIKTVRFGRLHRVPVAWLKRHLGIKDAA